MADLTGVRFLCSIGLSVLLAAHARGADSGVPLIVVAPPGGVPRSVIQGTGVDQLLTLADVLDDALSLP